MSLENLAIDKLGIFLGLDPGTLREQVLPYLMTFESPEDLSAHLHDMLGTNEDTITFIQDFVHQRFYQGSSRPTRQSPQPQQAQQAQQRQSDLALQELQEGPGTEKQFPSLPPGEKMDDITWMKNMNVTIKSTKKNTKKVPQQPASPTTSSKPKKDKNMSLDEALKVLDINAAKPDKRKECHCQATKHPLFTAAPNCLSCGKIICALEGSGPCTFCGTPVLSTEQQLALISEATKKRGAEKSRIHQESTQSRSSKGQLPPTSQFVSKLTGGIDRHYVADESNEEQSRRRRAEEHKDKLLEFQRTSAKRTTVIDQATEFSLPTDQLNPWQTPQERALALKQQQSNLKRFEREHSRARVLKLDLAGRKVTVEKDFSDSNSDTEMEEAVLPTLQPTVDASSNGSAGTFANNPLLKGLRAPKFCDAEDDTETPHTVKRKERVQYDAL